jgi:hypothetical protein
VSEPLFQPRLLADGRLDPECLELMSPDWLTGWMRERFSGRDPWFPLDRRSDEDPETLIVGLLRDLGSGHPLVPLLGRVARRLLDEAAATAPALPPYLRPLLRLCQQTALPATAAWFAAELETLAERPETFGSRWPERELADEILFAALRQAPGWPGSPARPAWEALLTQPETTTFALAALGTSLQQQISHLAVWWEACPQEERETELSQLIFAAVSAEGPDQARDILSKAHSLPPELRHVIDLELQANGARPVFAGRELQPLIGSGLQKSRDENRPLRVFISMNASRSHDALFRKILDTLESAGAPSKCTFVTPKGEDPRKILEGIRSADAFLGFSLKDDDQGRDLLFWEIGIAQALGLPTRLWADSNELSGPFEFGRLRAEPYERQFVEDLRGFVDLIGAARATNTLYRKTTAPRKRGHGK